MAGSEINRPFTYLPAEQGWVTIAISIIHPVRESFVVLHSYVFQMFNRNQDAKIAKLISLLGVLCAFARDKQTCLCFSFLTIGNCFEFRPPAWLRARISSFEIVFLLIPSPFETVSQCHPEAIAEGSRFSKWQETLDSSLCSE